MMITFKTTENWYDDYYNCDSMIDYDKKISIRHHKKDDGDKIIENDWKTENKTEVNITCKKLNFFC